MITKVIMPKVEPMSTSQVSRKYVATNYEEILDNYSKKYSVNHKSRFMYSKTLYRAMQEAFDTNSSLIVTNVNDPKVSGVFVYIDVAGLRTFDVPIECFSDKAQNTTCLDVLRSFDDK